jgi:hypothetical protein
VCALAEEEKKRVHIAEEKQKELVPGAQGGQVVYMMA